jgi:pimeloyl-ACP methyl ester carboxylesterase
MKTKGIIMALSLLLISAGTTMAQRSLKDIEGSWAGQLREAGINLRMVFNLTMSEADTMKATLDSPDQGAMGIPLGRVTLADDTLTIAAPMLRGQYRGVLTGDSTITGSWMQLGKQYTLDLKREAAPVKYNRPQEPVPPYPYREEEVTFRNKIENFDLAGTLTLPQGDGPFPAAVLITGSGSQDRDETIFYHKPFKVIADHLTRNGIAVLRYDDRGYGRSKGTVSNATSLSMADDAAAAVEYLMGRPEIDNSRIGLIGHSEGGLIASILASKDRNIAFIVSLAGPGVRGSDLLIQQNIDLYNAEQKPRKELDEQLFLLRNLFDMVTSGDDQRTVAKKAMEWYGKELDKEDLTPEQRREKMSQFTQALVQVNSPWMRYFLSTDPAVFWSKVTCPVLALNGGKDLQVNREQNLPAIKNALKKGGNRKVKTVMLPGLNHLFQHCNTGSISEYINIEETSSPEALDIITGWIRKTMKMKQRLAV